MNKTTQEDLTKLGTKEIAKRLRQTFKKKYPKCKFSITSEYYSGGSSLNISLMKANFKVKKTFEEIHKDDLDNCIDRGFSEEQIKSMQTKNYHQLNRFTLMDSYKENIWCNGVFLTEEGWKFFQEVMEEVYKYHYDHSDSQIDYFDTNFHIHLQMGKWDKDFIQEIRQ